MVELDAGDVPKVVRGRQSLSDWYNRPELSDDGGESNDEEAEESEEVNTALPPECSPSRRKHKRRSLGDWYLGGARHPSNWTPDTKVHYMGDDKDELVRSFQDSPHREAPVVHLFSDVSASSDDPRPRRRRHSLYAACATAKALPSSPSKRHTVAIAFGDDEELGMKTIQDFIGGNADVGRFTKVELEVPPATVEEFLARPAPSADISSEQEWGPGLASLWEVLKELFEDSRTYWESFTVYVWQNASAANLSCVPAQREEAMFPAQREEAPLQH